MAPRRGQSPVALAVADADLLETLGRRVCGQPRHAGKSCAELDEVSPRDGHGHALPPFGAALVRPFPCMSVRNIKFIILVRECDFNTPFASYGLCGRLIGPFRHRDSRCRQWRRAGILGLLLRSGGRPVVFSRSLFGGWF